VAISEGRGNGVATPSSALQVEPKATQGESATLAGLRLIMTKGVSKRGVSSPQVTLKEQIPKKSQRETLDSLPKRRVLEGLRPSK
jgi:hypothetical protein